jgi:SAM-dependent methyltransferase
MLRVLAYKAWKRLVDLRLRGIVRVLGFHFHQLTRKGEDVPVRDSFDACWGVDTNGIVPLYMLQIHSRNDIHGVKYQASPPGLFSQLMAAIKVAYNDFTFIDLGSGKGRVLLLASQLPFKRIIGIEFSRELMQIARANLTRCARVGSHIDLLWMDVEDYEFPTDQSVVYLYNPFDEKVMVRVINNLRLSLVRHPRELYIVYCNPLHASVIDRANVFTRVASQEGAVIYAFSG